MDQVKEALAVALKYGFWIGSTVVLIGALTVWYLSTSTLDKEIASQISSIQSDFKKVSQYQSQMPAQPNELSHIVMNEMIEERKGEVMAAWENVFDAQRNILTWPTIMKDEFLNEFQYVRDPETGKVDKSKLKLPFEKYEEFGNTEHENVNPELLRRYERYIGTQLPALAEIPKAKWTADFNKRPSAGMGMSMGTGMDSGYGDMMASGMSGPATSRGKVDITGTTDEPVVKWSSGSQEALLKDLFPWRGAKNYPSELDVYYSQENLWILKQLLQIVAVVNGDAKQAFEAKIREIKSLAIGKSVSFTEGTMSEPGSRISAGGMGGYGSMGSSEAYGSGMMDSMGGMGGEGAGYGMASDVAAVDPGDGRYVNTAFEPIDASSLRGAFSSNDPSQVAIAVAKRIPVTLKLQMEQQSIPALLAACGNAPLMVDVYQVRIMPKGKSSTATGGMGGGMGMDMGMSGMSGMESMGMGMDMGMSGMGSGGGAAVAGGADEEFPTDLDVEIYGLIYFWNPPSDEALGVDKLKDQAEITIDASAEVIDDLPNPSATTPAADTVPPTVTTPGTGTPATDATGTQPPTTPDAGTPPAPGTTQPAAPDAGDPATPGAATTPPQPAATVTPAGTDPEVTDEP
ncbi:hypothetical protein [Rhodopirellula sp. MGV]|uniref:hypothetical protein n=1 Tax=Rhodopirellula sp. MGV TaxID=2023130 RepID=UPI000B974E16|nr:hypothetical protein [Rhodopirellula sp. MGV]OYP33139.1 hypothetical protein CGZ80_18110 [Rhodopirellula sp. MGV]PNY35132.1 hypothetical protein C2E31_19710 [Rhodopirellula baltica]